MTATDSGDDATKLESLADDARAHRNVTAEMADSADGAGQAVAGTGPR